MRNCLYEVTLIKDLDGHLDYLILAFFIFEQGQICQSEEKKVQGVPKKNKAVALLKQQATALFLLGHPVQNLNCL